MPRLMNTRSLYTTKNRSTNTQWLQNASRTLGMSGLDAIKEISPNVYDVAENTGKAAQTIFRQLRRNSSKQKTLSRLLDNNQYIKLARKGLKNIKDDLKTGNFNNTERAEQALMNGEEDTSTSTYFGDDGASSSVAGSSGITVNVGGLATVADSVRYQTQSQAKMTEATINSIVAVSSASMLQHQQLGEQVLEHLGNINKGIQSLVAYQNENMTKFIESSIAYYETMGKSANGANETGNAKSFDKWDILHDGGRRGLKVDNYKKLIKSQFADYMSSTQVGQIGAFLKTGGEQLIANPLGLITTELMKMATPKDLKNAIQSVDKTLADFVPEMMHQLYSKWGNATGSSIADTFKRMVGNTFGLRVERERTFNTANRVTADPVPFDGITRNTITEIIPKYLREQTGYLKEITTLLGGDAKSAVANSEMFDIEEGIYKSFNDMQKGLMKKIDDSITSVFQSTEFGKNLSAKGAGLNEKDAETYEKLLNRLFSTLERMDTEHLDLSRQEDINTVFGKLNSNHDFSDNMMRLLEEGIKSTYRLNADGSDNGGLGLNSAIFRSRLARNRKIESISRDAYSNGLFSLQGIGKNGEPQSIDDSMVSVLYGTSSALSSNDKRRGSLIDKLDNIQFLLNRGINVKILEGEGFEDYLGNGTTERPNTTTSSHSSNNNSPATVVQSNSHNRSIDDMTPEEIAALISQPQEEITENTDGNNKKKFKFVRFVQNKSKKLNTAMNYIAHGKVDMGLGEISSLLGDGVKDIVTNTKNALFGDKDDEGKLKGGLFSKAINRFKEEGSSITSDVLTEIKHGLFGYTDENGEKHKGVGVIGAGTDIIKKGFEGWKDVLFGPETDMEDAKKQIKESIEKRSRSIVKGALAGGTLGITAGGLLGTLIGGPISGALLGSAAGYVAGNKNFQKFLFGDEITEEITDENGETKTITKRTGGLISQKTQEFFKKNKTAAIGGAALGGLKGMLGGGGLLGAFVGGPIAGALMGTGIALAAKSERFQNFIFGKEELDEEGNKKRVGGILNSFNKVFKRNAGENGDNSSESISKKVGMVGIGTGTGLLAGLFTPLGPIGGAALGLASSMYASKDRFRQFLFGDEENDEPGLAKRLGNIMTVEVLVPIKNSMKNWLEDMKTAAIEKVMQPIELAMGPIVNMGKRIYEKTLGRITDAFSLVGEKIKDAVSNAAENIRKTAINIITRPFKLFGRALTGLFKAGAGVVGGAVKKVGNFAEKSNRKASKKRALQEGLDRDPDTVAKWQREAREAGVDYEKYKNEQLETMYYNNRDRGSKLRGFREENAKRKEENAKRKEEAAKIEKRNQLVSRLTGGKFDASSEEGLQLAINNYMTSGAYKKGKKKYGLTPEEMLDILSSGKNSSESRDNTNQILNTAEAQLHTEEQQLNKLGELLSNAIDFKNGMMNAVQNLGKDLKYWADDKKDMRERARRSREDESIRLMEAVENSTSAEEYLENRGDMTAEEYREERGITIEDTNREKVGKFVRNAGTILKTRGPIGGIIKGTKYAKKTINDARQVSRSRQRVAEARDRLYTISDDDRPERGYATGTNNARPGVAVVGEDGPELIRFGGGEMVQNGRKPINVIIEGISKDAADKMNEQPDKPIEVSVVGANGALPTYVAGTLSRYTDNINRISKKIDGKGLINYGDIDDDINDHDGEEVKEEKQQSLFDKIGSFFSKFDLGSLAKNLAIVGVAAGGLLAFIKNGGFSGLGDTLKDAAAHLTENAEHGKNSLGDSKTSAEVINEVKEDVSDLKNGDLGGFVLGQDGEVDHTSGAKARALVKVGARVIAGKGGKRGKAIAKGLKSVSKKFLQSGINNGSSTALGAMKILHGSDAAINAAQKAGIKMSKKATKSAMKKAGAEVAEGATKGVLSKIWTFVKKGITTMGKKAGKLLGKKAPKFVQTATKFFDDILLKLSKPTGALKGVISKGIAKIASFLGINTGVASTGVGVIAILAKDAIWMGVGALANASNTAIARLFRCDESVVDGWMRAIAMCIGALAGSTPGTVIDMICELVTQITGVDPLSELASALYNFLASDEDYAKLEASQNAQKEEYNEYKNDQIQEAYEKYLIDNGLGAEDLSREEFEKLVDSGDATVDYDSYADWNDKQHEGMLSKAGRAIVNGASKTWGNVKKGASVVANTVKSGIETIKKGPDAIKSAAKNTLNKIKSGAKDILESAKEKILGTAAGKLINGIITKVGPKVVSYISGSSDAIVFDDVPEDNPAKPVIGVMGKVLEFLCAGPRMISTGTKKIVAGLKAGFSVAKTFLTDLHTQRTAYVEGTTDNITLKGEEDNPALEVVGNIVQFISTPERYIRSSFKKVVASLKAGFSVAKTFLTDLHTQRTAYVKGTTDDITLKGEEDNPALEVVGNIVQFVSTPERYIRSSFKKVVASLKAGFSVAKDFLTDLEVQRKSYVTGTTDDITLKGEEDNTALEVVGNIVQFVSTPERYIRSSFKKISASLKAGFNIAKDFATTVSTEVEDYTSGKSDKIDLTDGNDGALSPVLDIVGSVVQFITTPMRLINLAFNKGKDILKNAGDMFSGFIKYFSGDDGGYGGRGETKNGVPYYSQKDSRWSDVPYETGRGDTIGNSGCGPAAFAMAASKETGHDINPVQASRVMKAVGARDNTGTSWRGMSRTANAYGLRSVMSRKPSSGFIDSQLAAGHPVVLSGRSGGYGNNTPYTKAGHYVVATGIDGNGNYEISDPNGRSTSRSYNKKDILQETGAAWSFGGRGLMPTFSTTPTTTESALMPGKSDTTSNTSTTSFGNRFALAPSWTSAGQSASKASAEVATNTGAVQQGAQTNLNATSGENATDRERWLGIVKSVKSAIAAQSPGYSTLSNPIHITINVGGVEKSVRTDCSGFVTACLKYYGVLGDNANLSSREFATANNSALSSANFTHSAWNGWEALSPGDIIAINGHVEIFAGNDGGHKVYNCGSDKSVNTAGATNSAKSQYTDVWSPGPAGANAVTGTYSSDGATVSDTQSSTSSGGGFWSKITSFFTELGSRAVEGITTGKWNTDWSGWMSQNNVNSSGATSDGGSTNSGSASISSANLTGSENAEKAYNFLIGKGYTKAGAAGLLGNLKAESGIEPKNLQDSGNKRLGVSDDQYTSNVDSGTYGNFVNDSIGYGLAQWTSAGRKKNLLEYAKSNGTSIGDLGMQLSFLDNEMKSGYKTVYDTLTKTDDLKTASDIVLHKFESPADQSVAVENKRASLGKFYYDSYANNTATNTTTASNTSTSPWAAANDALHSGGYGNASIDKDYDRLFIDEPVEDGGYGNPSVEGITDTTAIPMSVKPTSYTGSKTTSSISSANDYWNQAIQLLNTVTELLTTANGNLESISGGISNIPASNNINNIDNRTVNNTTSNNIRGNASKMSSKGYNTAAIIAKGGL